MDFQILRGDLDPRSTTATSVRGDAAPFQREQCGLLLRCCRRVAGTTSHTGTGVPPESRSQSGVFPLGGRLPSGDGLSQILSWGGKPGKTFGVVEVEKRAHSKLALSAPTGNLSEPHDEQAGRLPTSQR